MTRMNDFWAEAMSIQFARWAAGRAAAMGDHKPRQIVDQARRIARRRHSTSGLRYVPIECMDLGAAWDCGMPERDDPIARDVGNKEFFCDDWVKYHGKLGDKNQYGETYKDFYGRPYNVLDDVDHAASLAKSRELARQLGKASFT